MQLALLLPVPVPSRLGALQVPPSNGAPFGHDVGVGMVVTCTSMNGPAENVVAVHDCVMPKYGSPAAPPTVHDGTLIGRTRPLVLACAPTPVQICSFASQVRRIGS